MIDKRGLGPIQRAGQTLPFGKGAVAGGFVFLSGLDGAVSDDGAGVEDVGAQTELALDRLQRHLADAGATLDGVVKLVWHVADRTQLPGFFAARERWMARECPALLADRSYASTIVLAGLATRQMLVEVDSIAQAADG